MSSPIALQPVNFPLRGARLIEASAGTGKTWTIAALYVRLVLGHGGEENAFVRPLLPTEILVVTFTEAATQELRDRIRKRLHEASRCFRGQAQPDGFLRALIDSYHANEHLSCARRLEIAAEWMDDAAIYTIHSWCNRMLRQHAFDSGSPFNLEIATNTDELLDEAARDYWRIFFYPLDEAASAAVAKLASGPAALLSVVKSLLRETEAEWRKDGEPFKLAEVPQTLMRHWTEWDKHRQELDGQARSLWAGDRADIEAMLDQASANGWLNGTHYPRKSFPQRLGGLAEWAESGTPCDPKWLDGFAQSRFKMNKNHEFQRPKHPAFDALDRRLAHQADEPPFRLEILAHATKWIRARFAEEKMRRALVDFDDLLTHLEQALQKSGGGRLAEAIRNQYPVALIDEFQDTDPLQYRIFASVYPVQETSAQQGLVTIGDPKQAIYAFRGADIYSYLQARKVTAGRHYTLGTNFRSTTGLVDAVNQVFRQGENWPGGAFLFGCQNDNPLPFRPVSAQGRTEQWQVEAQPQPALTFWHLPNAAEQPAYSLSEYSRLIAESTASEIVRLLNLGAQNQSGFANKQGQQPLRPADIAILVRSGTEAETIRRELARRRVRSVYLSERDSVFATPEAGDLLYWLQACAEPVNHHAVRAALGTATLALGYAELELLNHDEARWEDEVERFRGYRKIWQSQGVLPMLRRMMADFGVPSRCLALEQGERSLTNLLHLAEWLQSASVKLDGELALIRHLAEAREGGGAAPIETLLRLESDADLIKVVTIHKSKGLEYPLVFLPFACAFREIDAKALYQRYHDAQGHLQIEFGHSDEARQLAEGERMQEDLRLLYVALTRARHACWLGIATVKRGATKKSQLHKSALGHLLNGGGEIVAQDLAAMLESLRGDCVSIAIGPPPESTATVYRPHSDEPNLRLARDFTRRPLEPWWIASYSALQLEAGTEGLSPIRLEAPDTPSQANLEEAKEPPSASSATPGVMDLHRFPRGAKPGTFLHGLLEWAAREGFGRVAEDSEWRKGNIALRCHSRGLERWVSPLNNWLGQFLTTPLALPEGSVALSDLSSELCQAELEFWFAASCVDTLALDKLVTRYALPGLARPKLLPNQVNGMLKGFIDLVFEHQTRYYILDYKSNWLGPDAAAYTPEAMRGAVLENRYELQYALYLLALHRQLKVRLPGYDYDRHIGGAAYLFLRGLDGPHGGLHYEKPPRILIESLDTLFANGRWRHDA